MSICVCARCKKPWKAPSSPARCPDCGQVSFAIAIQVSSPASTPSKKRWQDPEYRAKLSAASKKLWQDPEFRAMLIATHRGKHMTAEARG